MKQLRILQLDGLLLNDSHWPVLANLTNLESLEIENRSGLPIASSFVSAISDLRSLNSLRLGVCDFKADDFSTIASLPKLGLVRMSGPIGQDELSRLTGMPSLRVLQINTNREIPEAAVESFKRESKALQTLSIRDHFNGFHVTQDDNGIVVHGNKETRENLRTMLDQTPPKLVGESIPPGNEFDLSQYKGKVVVVHFWRALSVGREARPDELHVRDVMKKFKDRDVQVVGVHVAEGADKMEQFISEQDIDWPCFVDKDNESSDAWKNALARRNMLYLINRQGNVKMAQVYLGDLERAIQVMLEDDDKSEKE